MIEPQETRVIDGKTFLRVEPDVAYMPVPRCDTCLLWGDGWPNFNGGRRWAKCAKFGGNVKTDEDFGCVSWEPKA